MPCQGTDLIVVLKYKIYNYEDNNKLKSINLKIIKKLYHRYKKKF